MGRLKASARAARDRLRARPAKRLAPDAASGISPAARETTPPVNQDHERGASGLATQRAMPSDATCRARARALPTAHRVADAIAGRAVPGLSAAAVPPRTACRSRSQPTATIDLPAAGYRFIPAVFQYSAGVAALPGFRIERVRFAEPIALAEGWRRIAALLEAIGRPRTAFCACELRSPAPFTEAGFVAFNRGYATVLGDWGVLREGRNPVARSNVCPELAPPAEPGFHAFCYTVPDAAAAPSFVVAGSGEAEEGHALPRPHHRARRSLARRAARQGTLRAGRDGAADGGAGGGGTRPAVQAYTVTIRTPSWRRRSSPAAPRGTA